MRTTMIPRATPMFLGAFQMMRGMEMAIPKTGSIKIASRALRFFFTESLKLVVSLIFYNTPVHN